MRVAVDAWSARIRMSRPLRHDHFGDVIDRRIA